MGRVNDELDVTRFLRLLNKDQLIAIISEK